LRPQFISFKLIIPNQSTKLRVENLVYQKTIDSERQRHYCEWEKLSYICQHAVNKLEELMLPEDLNQLLRSIDRRQNNLYNALCSKKYTKLRAVLETSNLPDSKPMRKPSRAFAPPQVNLTDVSFSESETTLLKRGKQFAIKPQMKRSITQSILLADLGTGLRTDSCLNSNYFSRLINDTLVSSTTHPLPKRELLNQFEVSFATIMWL
jgi:hypothetical protein